MPGAERRAVDAMDMMDAPALNDSARVEAAGEAHKPSVVRFPNDTAGVELD